jgi:hypothetical protein
MVITSVVWLSISRSSIERQIREYDQRIGKLKVGMEEKDLVLMMGNPQSKETVKPEDWQLIPEDIKSQHKQVLAYGYSLVSFFSTSELRSHTIFLDESNRRILYIMPTIGLSVLMGFRAGHLFFLILAFEAALTWLAVRWWCRRKNKLGL